MQVRKDPEHSMEEVGKSPTSMRAAATVCQTIPVLRGHSEQNRQRSQLSGLLQASGRWLPKLNSFPPSQVEVLLSRLRD